MPRRPTPTPREMRALETAAATELAAGVREVERLRLYAAPPEPLRDRRGRIAADRFVPWERGGRYRLSTWDHDEQEWEPYWTGLSLMGIRAVLRLLYEAGWDKPSFLVEREGS